VEEVKMKGSIEKMKVGRFIQFAAIDLNAKYKDLPSNYIKATYELTPKLGKTQLSVTQGDYSQVENGKRRFINADDGLNKTLYTLKTYIETNCS
jgi:hypothetical protein